MADPFDPGRVVVKEGRLVSLKNFSVSGPVQNVRTIDRDEQFETIQKSRQPSKPDCLQIRVLPPEPVKGEEAESKPDSQMHVDPLDPSELTRREETKHLLKCVTPDPLHLRILPPAPIEGDEMESKLNSQSEPLDGSETMEWNGNNGMRKNIPNLKCSAPDPHQVIERDHSGKNYERSCPPLAQGQSSDPIANHATPDVELLLRKGKASDPTTVVKGGEMRTSVSCSVPPVNQIENILECSQPSTQNQQIRSQSSESIVKGETPIVEDLQRRMESSESTPVFKIEEVNKSIPDALQVKKCSSKNVSEPWRPPSDQNVRTTHLQITEQSEFAALGETPRMEDVLMNVKSSGARHIIKQEGMAKRLQKCSTGSVQEISDDEDNVEKEEIFLSPMPEHFEDNKTSCSPGETAKDLNETVDSPMNVPPCTPSEVIKTNETKSVQKCSPQAITRDLNEINLEGVEKSCPPAMQDLQRTQLSDPTVREETESKQDLQMSLTPSDPAEVIKREGRRKSVPKSSFPDVFQVGSEIVTIEKSCESSTKEQVQIVTGQSEVISRDRKMHVTDLPKNVALCDSNEICEREEKTALPKGTFPCPVPDIMVQENPEISDPKELFSCSAQENLHSVGCNTVMEDQEDLEMSVETCDSKEAMDVESTLTTLSKPTLNSHSDSIETTEQTLCKPMQDCMQLKAGWCAGGRVDNERQDLAINMRQDPGMNMRQDHLGMNVRPDLGINVGQNLEMNVRQDHVVNMMRQDLGMRPDLWLNMRQAHPGMNVRQDHPGINGGQNLNVNMNSLMQSGIIYGTGVGIRQAHPGMVMRQDLGMDIRQNLGMNSGQVHSGMNVRQAHPGINIGPNLNANIMNSLIQGGIINGTANTTCVAAQSVQGASIGISGNGSQAYLWTAGLVNQLPVQTGCTQLSIQSNATQSNNGNHALNASIQGGRGIPVPCLTLQNIRNDGHLENSLLNSTKGKTIRQMIDERRKSHRDHPNRKKVTENSQSNQSRDHLKRACKEKTLARCRENVASLDLEEEGNSQDSSYKDSEDSDNDTSDYEAQASCENSSPNDTVPGIGNGSNDAGPGPVNSSPNDADPGPFKDIEVQENLAGSKTKDPITHNTQENMHSVGCKPILAKQEDLEMSVDMCDSREAMSVDSTVASLPEPTLNVVRPDLGMNARQAHSGMNVRQAPGMDMRQVQGINFRQDFGMNMRQVHPGQDHLGVGIRQAHPGMIMRQDLGTDIRQNVGMNGGQVHSGMIVRPTHPRINVGPNLNANIMIPLIQGGIINGTANTTCVTAQSVQGASIGISGNGSQSFTQPSEQSDAAQSKNGSHTWNASIQGGGRIPVPCLTVQSVGTDGHRGNSLLNSTNEKTIRELIDERRMSHQDHPNRENVTEGSLNDQSRGHLKRACKEKTLARCRENVASLDSAEEESQDSSYVDSDDDASGDKAEVECEKTGDAVAGNTNSSPNEFGSAGNEVPHYIEAMNSTVSTSTNNSTKVNASGVPIKCSHCERVFENAIGLRAHMVRTHPKVGLLKCKHCGRGCTDLVSLKRHSYVHTGKYPFKCDVCGKGFSRKQNLVIHVRIKHTGEKPFKCDKCEMAFARKNSLSSHLNSHLTEKLYLCKFCGKAYKRWIDLNQHEHTHGEKKFKCKVCEKLFYTKKKMDDHRSLSHNIGFICDICGKRLASKKAFKRHMVTHSDERPFKCPTCGRAFKTQQLCLVHERIHTNSRPFSCKTCGDSFTQYTALVRHKNTHTGAKPFTCDLCGKSFTQTNSLVRHKRIHTGERPFKCDKCGVSYIERYPLTVHMKTHEEEEQ